MKKKMISGLVVGLFAGVLGFSMVSEAVGKGENHHMNSIEMRRYRKSTDDVETKVERNRDSSELSKEEADESQKNQGKLNDYSRNRRENNYRSHMRGSGSEGHGRMNNSCW